MIKLLINISNITKLIILTSLFLIYSIFSLKYPIYGFIISTTIMFSILTILKKRFNSKIKYISAVLLFFIISLFSLFLLKLSVKNNESYEVSVNFIIKKRDYIPYVIVNKRILNYKYQSISIDAITNKEDKYTVNQIKVTLKTLIDSLRNSEKNADYLIVNLFERKLDFDNQQSYTLGTVKLKPKSNLIKLDFDNESIKGIDSYKYDFLIRRRNESKRPSKNEYKIYDRFYFLTKFNPYLSTDDINKMIEREFKISYIESKRIFLKVNEFQNSKIIHIID